MTEEDEEDVLKELDELIVEHNTENKQIRKEENIPELPEVPSDNIEPAQKAKADKDKSQKSKVALAAS